MRHPNICTKGTVSSSLFAFAIGLCAELMDRQTPQQCVGNKTCKVGMSSQHCESPVFLKITAYVQPTCQFIATRTCGFWISDLI